ncbi:hypothetical protein PISMIDRAFT_685753 [Pisolithus microcarpus 441]|uniref:Uncharacterized protein n=1 Tax=Pisolithus microcarpus 441 TaxID=765257 RepID=A0A0C9ZAW2_9AGAM|nr:hypothetical protein PISMIDRAFT_685753 [Pisolithus microcarpus 441]
MASPNLTSMNRLIDARDRLLASGLYLGDSSITSNLQWVRNGRAHVLSYVPNTQSHGVHACANPMDNGDLQYRGGLYAPTSMSHAGKATANSTDSSNTVPSDDGSPSHGGDTTANRTDTTDTIPSDDSSLCLTGDTTVHTTVNSITLPSDDSLDRPRSPPPEPAVLRAIVRIDSDDFWLTADGGYLGPNTVWKEIANVKPSCTVTDPGLDPITSDYDVVIHVLQDLTQKCVTAGYSSGTSFFSTKDTGAIRFKLRHTLFESLDAADTDGEEDSSTPSDTAVSEAFSFERWPLTKEKNRAELLSLKSTHRILPLPAYDLENYIIRPGSYRRVLQGAIMEVHFTLSHWAIAAAK